MTDLRLGRGIRDLLTAESMAISARAPLPLFPAMFCEHCGRQTKGESLRLFVLDDTLRCPRCVPKDNEPLPVEDDDR